MIDIITRVRHEPLFNRMKESALDNAHGVVGFITQIDHDKLPHIAKTYNLLGRESVAEYIVFCHDDVVFMTPNWDLILEDEFQKGYDIIGAVGSRDYQGGTMFSRDGCGKYATGKGEEIDSVKVLSKQVDGTVDVSDGMFLAVKNEFFTREKFDEQLDELFFYAEDLCLRGKVGITHNLIGHHKPKEYYGKYPENMRTMKSYEPYFYKKWGFKEPKYDENRCAIVPLDAYYQMGQDACYDGFEEKYGRHSLV